MEWIKEGITLADCQKAGPLDLIDTRILLMHALGLSRIQLITQSDMQLTAAQAQQVGDLLQRRYDGEPIAYLIGEREFFGLPFHITADVLIPRPDTELLVELAIQHTPQNSRVLDMGTGSGAIAIAIAHQRRDTHVSATDISAAAVAVAQKNADRNVPDANMHICESDWYSALAGQHFHTIVANPPYIQKDDHHLSQGDLRFEPTVALTDHADGLTNYRHIIKNAAEHLYPQGWLLMEHGYNQAQAVRDLLTQHGFIEVQSWLDLSGIDRVSGGRLK
ncbi:peptide chain release factor N(5)-glutamine methyltransferase [Undibacterium sp. RTI2.1]|uniref:peptide chain release factor N(5)-glutamine methyltransferase n=1 Tax=unclassified Undibacterium TaxID=2630295 RepID=UPI002B22E076|nr:MULTISPECIES: peptide chain release factor N(5)-glutamine methyltransferase [unclassified Undibacterium]MEB0030388.1 peptide chain release factor N(5)-glutamine methyltransferase [Undibacterium sp. RTI2.1]MEB0115331.1 peptide chain release factor N(5)-glutamine methyltransferase [Undibacterium sp. RTI2.2]